MSLLSDLHYVGGQIATCDAKCRFPTKGGAMIHAHKSGYPRNKPYRCPICDEWHLTSK